MLKNFKNNFPLWALGGFWLFALLNPVFKKYDYGAEYPLVLVFAVLVAVLAVVEFRRQGEECPTARLERLFLLIFGLFTALSFAFSQTKNVGFSEVLAFLSMVLLYLVYGGRRISWMGKLLKMIKVGAVLAVIMGFSLYFWRDEPRMMGPFFNILYHANVWPNAFAMFLLMVWPLFIVQKPVSSARLPRQIILSFLLAALLLTFSRGAVLVFGGQILLLAIYFFKRISKSAIAAVFLLVIFTGAIFLGTNYLRGLGHEVIDVKERATFSNSEGLTSQKERLDFWKGALELAKERPFFGWGPFSFRYAYNGIQKDPLANADHPHNIFLKIAMENGVIALAGFCAFMLTIMAVVVRRFRRLGEAEKDLGFMIFLGVAGAFAHSLIDYNFNFLANLLLLFIFLIMMRSLVVQNEEKASITARAGTLIFSLVLTAMAIFEGVVLVIDKVSPNSAYLSHSLYPRNFYLAEGERLMQSEDFKGALDILDRQTGLNPLDAQAWHLAGVVYCNEKYEKNNPQFCTEFQKIAIKLNPKNDLNYYADYLRAGSGGPESLEIKNEALNFLEKYFDYVEKNVHFTAYTPNVEAAAGLVDVLIQNSLVDKKMATELMEGKGRMLETAAKLRDAKTF